jgi:hypothetical protein
MRRRFVDALQVRVGSPIHVEMKRHFPFTGQTLANRMHGGRKTSGLQNR